MAKKKFKTAKREENPLFVGVSDGADLRKRMLECSRGVLEALKEGESLKNLREEKIKLLHQFKGEVKEVSKLVSSLRASLPKVQDVKAKDEVKQEKKAEKEGAKQPQEAVKADKKPKTELEVLEAELDKIENKLNRL